MAKQKKKSAIRQKIIWLVVQASVDFLIGFLLILVERMLFN